MPAEPASRQLDEDVLETATAASGLTRATQALDRFLDRRRGDHGGISGLGGWLLIALAVVGLLASTPPSAGPDEPSQEAAAWYMSGHGLPPHPTDIFLVPASVVVSPCYAGNQTLTAACMPARNGNAVMVQASSVVNYPPPYYWVVGAGERLAAQVGLQYADIGARVASVLLNLGALFLLSLYMRRRHPRWGSFLLMVSTPMAVFLGVVVNPSGWEITCGLIMAAALAEVAWTRPPGESEAWSRGTAAVLVLASIGLCTARPLGFVWACGLTVSAMALAPAFSRRVSLRVAMAVAPGVALGLLWSFTHPSALPVLTTGTPVPTTIPNVAKFFTESVMWFPERVRQMFGVLGWLDTPEPEFIFFGSLMAWAVVLVRLPSTRKFAMLCGIVGIVILPSAIEAIGWGVWPGWWQGRYSMPFAFGFLLLLLLRSGRFIPRTIAAAAAIAVMALGVMVWVNGARYAYGLTPVGLPMHFSQPGVSTTRIALSVLIGAVLILVSGYLLLQAWRMKPDTDTIAQPDAGQAAVESYVN